MKIRHTGLVWATAAALTGLTAWPLSALAQVAGTSTTLGVAVAASTEVAMGWSVKKTLMGKTIYNEFGAKVGKVEDLIIAPDKNVSFVIVGAGGFIGMGRHDVAIPVSQVKTQAGRLVMAGGTQDAIKAMPEFNYAYDTTQRDAFIAKAETEVTRGKAKVADLQKRAGAAAADGKAKLEAQATAVQADLTVAEAKLAEMSQATAKRWHEFEAGVNAATLRLRKAVDAAVG